MVKHNQLVKGKYYEVLFTNSVEKRNSYLVQAISSERVRAKWCNGKPYETTGLVTGAKQIIEISQKHYEIGHLPFETNQEARHLLVDDYWEESL